MYHASINILQVYPEFYFEGEDNPQAMYNLYLILKIMLR
jgi:hypothetical protein